MIVHGISHLMPIFSWVYKFSEPLLILLMLPDQLMDLLRNPFKGVVADVKGRAAWYKHDWVSGLRAGIRSVLFKLLVLEY